MGKNKLWKFIEMKDFSNVFEPPGREMIHNEFHMKGLWRKNYFQNNNPIVLELGCGKGEYTVGLAERFPEKNFIGVDIKGARMWKGAKYALVNNMPNVAFVRTRIEFLTHFFEENEVDEIWITFPDPREKDRWALKRLTSSRFLNLYRVVTCDNAIIHLKTDNALLHEYTKEIVNANGLEIIDCTNDLYNDFKDNDILSIRTFYESGYLEEGKKITYIRFRIKKEKNYEEPESEE